MRCNTLKFLFCLAAVVALLVGIGAIWAQEEHDPAAVPPEIPADAKAMKLSKSKWIADAIREKLMDEWPANVRELAGSWKGFPTLEELREMERRDFTREAL